MKFKIFAGFLSRIENTNGRTEMTKILVELFRELTKNEIKFALYLIQGRLAPKFVSLEFNFSAKLILKALDLVLTEKKSLQNAHEYFLSLGDIGLVAEKIKLEINAEGSSEQKILEVYLKLKDLAHLSGKGSQESKILAYLNLFNELDTLSIKFVSRIITGDIRLGISDKTILDSLSWFKAGNKSLRGKIDIAFGARSDIGELSEIIITSNESLEEILNEIKVKPFTPVASKLVEREANSKAVWERMPNCFVQPKLDGLRGQIHYSKILPHLEFVETKNNAMIFSRNMENMTDQFPELTKSVENLGVDSIILDSEIIGVENTGKYKSYQETMQRRRKFDIEIFSSNIPVKAMCFDILFLNGKDLTNEPIEKRLELLKEILKKSSNLEILETKQMKSENELEEYFKLNVENRKLEGIITKEKESIYEPGTRNFKWIKLKANARRDLIDTIDVAVMGYYIGRGDRNRFGFGALLAGVYNPDDEKYYSIGKIGSGFSEEQMKEMFKDMKKLVTDKNEMPGNYVVAKTLAPDFWIKPQIIMEIDADEITRSPNHTAAIGISSSVKNDDSTKGLSIRFPRMKIWKRDKNLPNTVDEIVRMYELRMMSKEL